MKETETMIKRVIPYLKRRGYEIDNNMFFEETVKVEDTTLFQDIVIKKSKGAKTPLFVIEVKRDTLKIEQKHINQALKYGKHTNVPFVVVTNGVEFRMYNVNTKKRIQFNSITISKIPSYSDIDYVFKIFKNNPEVDDIILTTDKSLPFRPTVSASQLEDLLKRCHNIIRNVEKDETHIFSDLSKIIFLKLLEEKKDSGEFPGDITYPMTQSFYELSQQKDAKVTEQTVKVAITQIFTHPKFKDLAPVASGDEDATGHEGIAYKSLLYIKNDQTYQKLINELSKIHFMDAEVDVKGTVFEYFIRATLQGRKGLGQYFTPRPLIQFMFSIVNVRKLLRRMQITQEPPKIVDPACGSGGFLVYGLALLLKFIKEDKDILTKDQYEKLVKTVKENIFWGQDANPSIVVAAKMNMIIAGDGSSNIYQGNTLANTNLEKLSKADLYIANPPFGSSESDSLSDGDLDTFDIKTTTAQGLFMQYMISQTSDDGGEIITIIDESILNAAKWRSLREYILRTCYIEAIISLPKAAFAPNKINVKTSILYLRKKNEEFPEDYVQDYPIRMIQLHQVGYNKKGDISNPNIDVVNKVVKDRWEEIAKDRFTLDDTGGFFESYPITIKELCTDSNVNLRIDYKFHDPLILDKINELYISGAESLADLCEPTKPQEYEKELEAEEEPLLLKRGKTPAKASYNVIGASVRMIKAGNIGKIGPQIGAGIDYVTEELAGNYEYCRAKKGDILLASTGEGTLGKSIAVRRDLVHSLVDGHVTIIRLKRDSKLLPEFVVWFLRSKMGQIQIERLYTGSTGQIELTERDVEGIILPIPTVRLQMKYIKRCRALVRQAADLRRQAEQVLEETSQFMLGD